MLDLVCRSVDDARSVLDALRGDESLLRRAADVGTLLAERLRRGQKVLVCGNGGSSCDAAHFAEELTGRFRPPPSGQPDRRPLAAIACTDVGHITCTANDYGFEHVFSRWVHALGRGGDVLIVLSTSGNSPNIVKAVEAAREIGMIVIGLLGKDGGRLLPLCDHGFVVPGATSDRIQELHMLLLHIWCECIEAEIRREG